MAQPHRARASWNAVASVLACTWLVNTAIAEKPLMAPVTADLLAADCCLTPGVPIAFGECRQLRKPAWYFQAEALALRREVSFDADIPLTFFGQRIWAETANPNYVEPPSEGEPDTRSDEETHRSIWIPRDRQRFYGAHTERRES